MVGLSGSENFWGSVYDGESKTVNLLLESNGKAKPFSCIAYLTIIPFFSFIVGIPKLFFGLKSIDDIVASEFSKIVLYARYYELKNVDMAVLKNLSGQFYKEDKV